MAGVPRLPSAYSPFEDEPHRGYVDPNLIGGAVGAGPESEPDLPFWLDALRAKTYTDYIGDQFKQGDNTDLLLGVPQLGAILGAAYDPIGTARGAASGLYDFLLRPAIEGAQRSAVAQEGPPIFDDGGQYVSGAPMVPLDAFSAASLAPIAGVGMRAAGMATGPSRDAFMAENLARQFPEEKVITGGNPIRDNWFGVGDEPYWGSSRGLAREHDIQRASRANGMSMSWDPVAQPLNDLPAAPMTDYDLGALNQAWRNKVVKTRELFANDSRASLPSLAVNAGEGQPKGIRAFRGTENSGQSTIRSDTPFFSSDREIAESYSEFFDDPAVHEAFLNFQNPYTLDAGGRRWDRISHNGKITTTDDLAAFAAKQGHDGLVVNNVIDPPTDGIDEVLRPSSVYAALRRGTVTGRNGDLLFANPSSSSLPYLFTGGEDDKHLPAWRPMD